MASPVLAWHADIRFTLEVRQCIHQGDQEFMDKLFNTPEIIDGMSDVPTHFGVEKALFHFANTRLLVFGQNSEKFFN